MNDQLSIVKKYHKFNVYICMYTSKAFLRHYLIYVPDSFLFENGRMIPLDHILESGDLPVGYCKLMLFLFSSIKYGKL